MPEGDSMLLNYIRSVFAVMITAICLPLVASAEDEAGGTAEGSVLETWADDTLNKLYDGGHITGAVVSVVKNGELLFAKGYGEGNVVTEVAANPATTRARIGSTTKTFTATIIAQLMVEGLSLIHI